jgi:hypothetical protein
MQTTPVLERRTDHEIANPVPQNSKDLGIAVDTPVIQSEVGQCVNFLQASWETNGRHSRFARSAFVVSTIGHTRSFACGPS